MLSLRRYRRWLASMLIATLLCVQWTVAAYACPMQFSASWGASSTAASSAGMPGCHGDMTGMDAEQPQLCKAHCQAGQQSVNSHADLADMGVALGHGLALLMVLDLAAPAARAALQPPLHGTGPPAWPAPLFIVFKVLRN